MMKIRNNSLGFILLFFAFGPGFSAEMSDETEECIACHQSVTPGIVASWEKSRHSHISPEEGLKKDELQRRISSESIDDGLKSTSVGCYECHSLNAENHSDNFEHNGFDINIVVSPADCASCHSTEAEEYSQNIMAHAYANLMENDVYQMLLKSINGTPSYEHKTFSLSESNDETKAETCLYCHGTDVQVTGMETRDTDFGEMDFPVLKNWPNQGVGRLNPDGSKGACTSCHPRHDFSIETARKPYTCSECHKGPDVPAYKVYQTSKHGNIFYSQSDKWDFSAVPWVLGEDFTAPTCAVCHASLITDSEGTVIAKRTHAFNDRLAWRLFGAPYAHPHPKSPELNKIKNSQGLPLATELDGTPVSAFLISGEEMDNRNRKMKAICLSCHSTSWVEGHFKRLENTIHNTNEITKNATFLISEIWDLGLAQGLPQGANLFDEAIEREWVDLWLFQANTIRFSSAMGGGGDYSVFADGRYTMSSQYMKIIDWYEDHSSQKNKKLFFWKK